MIITSTANNRIKQLIEYSRKRKKREKDGVFLVEGIRMFREIPKEYLLEVYVSETCWKKEHVEGIVLSDTVFSHVADTKTPQGIMALVRQRIYKEDELINKKEPCILFLEDLQDPGNLGTIIRSAEAAGMSGVLISQDSVDIYNPKTIRATMGSIFRVPFCYIKDKSTCMEQLKKRKITIYAAHLSGKKNYDNVNYKTASAFLIGNEGNGLSEALTKSADVKIKIPMEGNVESLNAAISATVLMFEAARQRRRKE